MADEAQDVQAVEETTEVPSTETETTQDTEVTQEAEAKTVPYDRLREVIDERNEIKNKLAELEAKVNSKPSEPIAPADPQREAVKQEFKKIATELGFVSKEELEQKDADKQLSDTMSSLESKYDGKNGLPKFDRVKTLKFAQENLVGTLEGAYKLMHFSDFMDHGVKEALGKTKGVKSEVSDGSGSSNIGTTDNDLKSAASRGDRDALSALIKRAL